ncbi:MFS transporter [Nocardioides agariphilus]|uniref:MFS transporter n=1 Tax=Nocardioides agariphilus TaxID=433664 RepID=UPI00352007BD
MRATSLDRARSAVATAFVLNGLLFATLFSRVPDLRERLDLSNAALGLLLLSVSAGSLLGLPSSGRLVERYTAAGVCRGGQVLVVVGLAVVALGAAGLEAGFVVAAGLLCYGFGTAIWDVAMNVEGTEVERRLGRTILPRFHAGWSFGSIGGAGIGVIAVRLDVPLPVHLLVVAAVSALVLFWAVGAFLVTEEHPGEDVEPGRSVWLEPRTLAIGAMVLAFTLAEGSANDWLALALVDGYDARQFVGIAGFGLFVCAMTTGRLLGPILLDRLGRVPVMLGSAFAATAGLLLVIVSGEPATAALGIVVWGLGAALGFPVGLSAAADDPKGAARRVSVVSTIGYGAFLSGPPLLGFVGNQVGTLHSLYVVVAAMVPAAVLVLAVRRPRVVAG